MHWTNYSILEYLYIWIWIVYSDNYWTEKSDMEHMQN